MLAPRGPAKAYHFHPVALSVDDIAPAITLHLDAVGTEEFGRWLRPASAKRHGQHEGGKKPVHCASFGDRG